MVRYFPRSHSSIPPHHRFLSPFLSSAYKSLFPQLLSFLIYTKRPGVPRPQHSQGLPSPNVASLLTPHCPLSTLFSTVSVLFSLFHPQEFPVTPPESMACALFAENTGGGHPLSRRSDASCASRMGLRDVPTFLGTRHSPLVTRHFPIPPCTIPKRAGIEMSLEEVT
jgi:hypothetical protein